MGRRGDDAFIGESRGQLKLEMGYLLFNIAKAIKVPLSGRALAQRELTMFEALG